MNTTPNSPLPVPPAADSTAPSAPTAVVPSAAAVRTRNLRVLGGTLLVALVLGGGLLAVGAGGSAASTVGAGLGGAERLQLMSTVSTDGGDGSTAPSTSVPPSGAGTRAERRAERRAEMDESVARHLGVTVDELHEARLAALGERLDDAVERGRLTREQADELLDAAREGRLREAVRELRGERRAERRGGR